jgi:hypothetical protein
MLSCMSISILGYRYARYRHWDIGMHDDIGDVEVDMQVDGEVDGDLDVDMEVDD